MTAHPYEYSDATGASGLAPGQLRANGWPASAVDMLYVSTVPAGAPALLALAVGDLVRVELVIDASWFQSWTVAGAPVWNEPAGYVSVPVMDGLDGAETPYGYALLVLLDTQLALGARDTYASMADLEAVIGASAGESQVRRRELCLIAATRWVAHRIGAPVTDELLDPGAPSVGVNTVPAKAAWAQATLEAAVRFYKGPDVPWGVAGGWDEAVYVRQNMPEVELILFGHRVAWGVA